MDFVLKNTPCGEIKGLETPRCLEFRGVRYARAGRFEMPVEEGQAAMEARRYC